MTRNTDVRRRTQGEVRILARCRFIALTAVLAFGACAGHHFPMQALQAAPGDETVGDAAAIVAHSTTDSHVTAIALNAANAFGAPLRSLSDGDGFWPLPTTSAVPNGVCHDGVESFVPDRSGDPDSQEVAQYYDRRCANPARISVYVRRNGSGDSETIDRSTWIYARDATAPVALRDSVTVITNAIFAPTGQPIASDGFILTTSTRLTVGSRVQSVSGSEEVALRGSKKRCDASAGYDAAGVPSLDATFGWQSASMDQAVSRVMIPLRGRTVVESSQIGRLFVGPIGSLSIAGGTLQPACPIARPAYALAGGLMSGTFKMAAQAVFRNGRLAALRVPAASMSGGYRFDVWTDSAARGARGERRVQAVLTDAQSRVAAIEADRFGDGVMTVTATGEEYRLIDWTVVR